MIGLLTEMHELRSVCFFAVALIGWTIFDDWRRPDLTEVNGLLARLRAFPATPQNLRQSLRDYEASTYCSVQRRRRNSIVFWLSLGIPVLRTWSQASKSSGRESVRRRLLTGSRTVPMGRRRHRPRTYYACA